MSHHPQLIAHGPERPDLLAVAARSMSCHARSLPLMPQVMPSSVPTPMISLRRMLRFCGLLTLALNTAGSIAGRQYGTALVDTVGPALLMGWSEVGPWMLRQIHASRDNLRAQLRIGRDRASALVAAVRAEIAASDPEALPQAAQLKMVLVQLSPAQLAELISDPAA